MKCMAVLIMFFAVGFSNCEAMDMVEEEQRFYTLRLQYNSEQGTIALSKDSNFPLSVVKYDFTQDDNRADEASQYYAQVLDGKDKILKLHGRDKFFLGRWRLTMCWDGPRGGGCEEMSEGEVQVSIPFFSCGRRIRIHNAKSGKLDLAINITGADCQ